VCEWRGEFNRVVLVVRLARFQNTSSLEQIPTHTVPISVKFPIQQSRHHRNATVLLVYIVNRQGRLGRQSIVA
jgi:hypothetical protein